MKPGFEPIVVARKPLVGTVAETVLRYGTGALNIGATRLPVPADLIADDEGDTPAGRYTPNVVISHSPLLDPDTGDVIGDACADGCVDGYQVAALDSVGDRPGAVGNTQWASAPRRVYNPMEPAENPTGSPGTRDSGGASRFFPVFRYQAKAPTKERPTVVDEQGGTTMHPTVKPLELMRWLVRLVAPEGGRILEPFAGSGTTVEAALIEGVECVAVELGEVHLPLIVKRLSKDIQPTLFGGVE